MFVTDSPAARITRDTGPLQSWTTTVSYQRNSLPKDTKADEYSSLNSRKSLAAKGKKLIKLLLLFFTQSFKVKLVT